MGHPSFQPPSTQQTFLPEIPLVPGPPPRRATDRRLAIEVDGSRPIREEVTTSGLRLRSRGGEYWLGQARKGVYEVAANQQLPAATPTLSVTKAKA